MNLAYHESPEALKVRIRAHERYSSLKMEQVLETYLAKKSHLRILDVGCGSGNYSPLFAKHASLYIGVDKNTDLLALAQKRCQELDLHQTAFMQGDMDVPLTFLSHSFDRIFYLYSAYYSKDVRALLRRTRDLLTPNGEALFVGPTRGNAVELDWISKRLFKTSGTKQKELRMNRLEDLFLPLIRKEFRAHKAVYKDFSVIFPNAREYMNYYVATPQYAELVASHGEPSPQDIQSAISEVTRLRMTKRGLLIRASQP